MNKSYSVWVIAGRKVGQRNSSIGVAERIDVDYGYIKTSDIETAGSLEEQLRKQFGNHFKFPDLVITSGLRESPQYAIELKTLSKGKTLALNINYPVRELQGKFDIVASEDSATFRLVKNPIWTIGVPHKITPVKLTEAVKSMSFLENSLVKNKPVFLAMIGGDIDREKGIILTEDDARDTGERIRQVVEKAGGQLLATNSPRITVSAWRKLKAEIEPVAAYIYDCHTPSQNNPLMAMLGQPNLASVIVTGDSVSMCCEALVPGKPTYIITTPGNDNNYYPQIHQELYRLCHARPFEDLEARGIDPEWNVPEPLDETGKVAEHAVRILDKKKIMEARVRQSSGNVGLTK